MSRVLSSIRLFQVLIAIAQIRFLVSALRYQRHVGVLSIAQGWTFLLSFMVAALTLTIPSRDILKFFDRRFPHSKYGSLGGLRGPNQAPAGLPQMRIAYEVSMLAAWLASALMLLATITEGSVFASTTAAYVELYVRCLAVGMTLMNIQAVVYSIVVFDRERYPQNTVCDTTSSESEELFISGLDPTS